jgi:hypothetical protein
MTFAMLGYREEVPQNSQKQWSAYLVNRHQ